MRSPQTAQTMRQMLQSVTQSGKSPNEGTGAKAAMDGYPVAGKTGTAQQVDPGCGCYAKSIYWITFAGMFPADHPRYACCDSLDALADRLGAPPPGPGAEALPRPHGPAAQHAHDAQAG